MLFRDASGQIVEERGRTAGRVLLWQRGPLLLRLETDVGLARAADRPLGAVSDG